MKILIADYNYPDIDLELSLFKAAGIEVVTAQAKTEDAVIHAAQGCQAILLQYAPISAKVLNALPQVGLICRYGAGYDTVDAITAEKLGVWVSNSPDYGMGEVATHALAMTLSLLRHLPFYDRDIRAGKWHFESAGQIRRASNLTVGIVGLGRIGKRYAHLARNCFARVVAYDPHIIDGDFPAYVERAHTLEDLFAQSDAVSLHCLLNPETEGLINQAVLQKFKPGSFLINTARGGLVDMAGLLKVLKTNHLGGVALDVLPTEPVALDSELLQHPRVILSPHSAFYSVEAERDLRRKAAQNIVTWAQKGRPDYVVVKGSRQPN